MFAQPGTCGSSEATFVDLLRRHFSEDIWGSESVVSNVTLRFGEHHSQQDDDDGCVCQFEIMRETRICLKHL